MDPTHRWRHHPSPPSSSTGGDDESPIMARYHPRGGGTLRSSRSVPALAMATWDGEPCPVHGGRGPPSPRHHCGSVMDFMPPHRTLKPYHHGSLPLLAPPPPPSMTPYPPPHLLPPFFRPRPYVIPAAFEPLPVRDPFKARTPLPHHHYAHSYKGYEEEDDSLCCKGHLIVLWIILGVVTCGNPITHPLPRLPSTFHLGITTEPVKVDRMPEDSSVQRMTEVRDKYVADALTNIQPHCEDRVSHLKDAMRGLAAPRTEEVIIAPIDIYCATNIFLHRLEQADKNHREILTLPRQPTSTMSHGNHRKK
ncbi:hypothetical protein LAZ67_5000837 [Cordylochernes scorpioides]|uniref:Uncharacterized protein n=1 Tax=Cordylochernes scorpioides TaxID=51811 RepID=A0ABY6KFY4_9ARAC|nr:hypothetical protein LAZ67_5000837 [Cordylochernes scorpioides]